MTELDDVDTKLIAALRRNGRASISDLSIELAVTRATVRARIERLTAMGEIVGFSVVMRTDAYERPVRGVTLIQINGKGADRIIRALDGFAEVTAIHTTNGKWDLILELGAETLPALDAALRKIRLIDGVENSETNLYLSTKRSSRGPAAATPA